MNILGISKYTSNLRINELLKPFLVKKTGFTFKQNRIVEKAQKKIVEFSLENLLQLKSTKWRETFFLRKWWEMRWWWRIIIFIRSFNFFFLFSFCFFLLPKRKQDWFLFFLFSCRVSKMEKDKREPFSYKAFLLFLLLALFLSWLWVVM